MPNLDARLQKKIGPVFAVLAFIFFAALHLRLLPFSSFFQRLEYAQLDLMFKLRGAIPPSGQIALVVIDDASLRQIGAWPWPRHTLAELMRRVAAAQPALIVGDFILPPKSQEPEGTAELARAVLDVREQQNLGVVLPYYFGGFNAADDSSSARLPAPLAASAFLLFDDPEAMRRLPVPLARAVYHSEIDLLHAALPGGHINVFTDESAGDAAVRWENQVIQYGGAYFPSLPIQIAAHFQRLTRAQILVKAGKAIQVGNRLAPIDAQGRSWINYYGPPGVFPAVPAVQLLQGHGQKNLRGKIVFIGVTAAGTQDFFQTPVSARMPGVEKLATATANLLDDKTLRRPPAAAGIELGLLAGLIVLAAVPGRRLRPGPAALKGAGIALLLAAGSFLLFKFNALWLQSATLMLATIVVTAGMVAMKSAASPSNPAHALDPEKVPRRLGRFEITGVLGEGAMGKIYAAFDPTISRKVAIKTIRPLPGVSAAGNAKMRQRFLHEARAAGALNHPNIVTIYHADEAGPYSYLVMEFLEGRTLEEIIRAEAPLPLGRVLEILLPVCEALQYAHQRGVVHRDLKPANIMLTAGGVVKLMDFGIAHIFSSTLTQEGALLGTPSYMAPEQMLGERADARADLFALGVVAYEMATRVQPFWADTLAAVSHRIVSGDFKPASALNARLPAAFDEVLRKALSRDKNTRYQTAMEFAVALVQLVPGE